MSNATTSAAAKILEGFAEKNPSIWHGLMTGTTIIAQLFERIDDEQRVGLLTAMASDYNRRQAKKN